jgi:hypothetical protein
LETQHRQSWDEYSQLNKEEKDVFFKKSGRAPYLNTLDAHFASESVGQRALIFNIEKGIVENLVGGMIYAELEESKVGNQEDNDADSDDDDTLSATELKQTFEGTAERALQVALLHKRQLKAKAAAMSIFVKSKNIDEDWYTATIPRSKTQQFELSVRAVADGASFRLASKMIESTCQVLSLPSLRSCTRQNISGYIRAVCAINLSRISSMLRASWAFSIAIDSATHFGTSYLDMRFRIYLKEQCNIYNFHACAFPMHERHTGAVIFKMVCQVLDELCPNWRVSLISATTDGAANMTGRLSGAVTLLQNHMHEGCDLFRIWCGAHQLDLVMQHAFTHVVHDNFHSKMMQFISHLTRQQKLIHSMGTTCPRVVNRWLSTAKVTSWFKAHRAELLVHIKVNNPSSAPDDLWWVYLLAMDRFTSHSATTFRKIQGLTTLVSQQQEELYNLIDELMTEVDATGPHTPEDCKECIDTEHETHVCVGNFIVEYDNVREYLVGLASWVEDVLDRSATEEVEQLVRDIAKVFCYACDSIHKIIVLRKNDNTPQADVKRFLPPVLPLEVVKATAAEFIRLARHQSIRLQQFFKSDAQIDVIADEHKALVSAHRHEPVLRDCIDACGGGCSFEQAWSLLSERFPNLAEFCGGIATIFPGTSTVESDFSVLRYEKDDNRKGLSDFGLSGILQSKQYKNICGCFEDA